MVVTMRETLRLGLYGGLARAELIRPWLTKITELPACLSPSNQQSTRLTSDSSSFEEVETFTDRSLTRSAYAPPADPRRTPYHASCAAISAICQWRNITDSDSPAPPTKKRTARSTRNPRTVIEPDSDDDEEMQDYDQEIEAEADPADSEGVDDDEVEDEEEEEDAEGEDDDMQDVASHPPPPKIQTQANSKGRPTVVVKPPSQGTLKSVEDKEMEDDDLSDLDSEGEDQDIGLDDDDELGEDDNEEDDDDSDNSREGTPDLTKLTRRQRGQFEEFDGGLLALSNEAQIKKHISAEEHAMRRAEMARRRKNLSEKRNEEEKAETINKLLKKPAPKRRTRAEILAAQAAGESGTPGLDGDEADESKPDAVYTRWVSASDGVRLGVPDEWLEAPVGETFTQGQPAVAKARIMVEEVA